MENGAFCRAAALRGSAYCRAHVQLQARTRRIARAGRAASRIKLPLLVDMEAVRVALARVQVALEAGHLDWERARLMRWGLRLAATNFRYMEQVEQAQTSLAEKSPELRPARKSNNLYRMPITIINSRALQ
jgi:hypothetical protein